MKMENDSIKSGSLYSFRDGFTWKIISKEEAKLLWNKNKEVFGLDIDYEAEGVIEEISDFESYEFFAIEWSNLKLNEND